MLICSPAFSLSKRDDDWPISTNAFVVPLRALKTTIFFSGSPVMSFATSCIHSGLPTDVPPNFITFMHSFFWDRKYTNENATAVFKHSGVYYGDKLFSYQFLIVEIIIDHYLDHVYSLRQVTQLIY